MCHFIISKDVYTECLLWEEKATDEASKAKPEEIAPEKSQLVKLLQLFHFRSLTQDLGVQNQDSSAGAPAPAPAADPLGGLAVHVIKQKTYFQCREVRENPDLADVDVDKRFCEDAIGAPMIPSQEPELASQYGQTACPVCDAVEKAIKKELSRIEVVNAGLQLRFS